MTNNHNYNTPSKGTTNWHTPLNENFERIDTDIEIRDAESNLDSYKPKQGAKFLATDTENEFIGDGTSWYQLGSSGQNPTFQSVSAANAEIGSAAGETGWESRPFITNGPKSINVPDDYETIQGALNSVPLFLRHKYNININANKGPYDENIQVPSVFSIDHVGDRGLQAGLMINGINGKPEVNSIFVTNIVGSAVALSNLRPTSTTGVVDPTNTAAVQVHSTSGVVYMSEIDFTAFSDLYQAILLYKSAQMELVDCDFGSGNVANGVRLKQGHTSLYVRGGNTGDLRGHKYKVNGGRVFENKAQTSSWSASEGVADIESGLVIDDQGEIYT
ncbi:hypothetical protein M0R89_19095 (plasmid) [Halorussus limi]|uniref:Uncharacterized protein n=1 Tax=Halorussus limi TaxID=2938695 RepID=A0A8U0I042_9EURY|nr:hypothetical protein [Halorussus limi]UPV76640.1 hypothetical protein M0R89_19095 [Halorussus limi]